MTILIRLRLHLLLDMKISERLEQWAESIRVDLVENYDKKGLRASGAYAKSLNWKVNTTAKGFQVVMLGARHSEFMENGRRPNQVPSVEGAKKLYPIIIQWNKDKNLNFDKGKLFAICLKIVYSGIQVPNRHNSGGVISEVVNMENLNKIKKDIGLITIDNIKSEVLNVIQ